jgi:geranylgeranyl reductase family protein
MRIYDAVIVGAGPAGSAAAYDLVQAGHSVLLVDRVSFPRAKACAGALTVKSLRALRYSVAPVVQTVCTDLVLSRESAESKTLTGDHAICAMTVRSELDEYCLRQTIDVGAEFRVITRLESVEELGDSVLLRTKDEQISARFLVGADGANSQVRRLTDDCSWFRAGLAIEACVPYGNEDRPLMEFDFGAAPDGYAWVFPKKDHANIGMFTANTEVRLSKSGVRNYGRSKLKGEAEDFIGHQLGLGGAQYKPIRRRVFLVGDAAGMAEPLLGEGIHNAIKSGQAVASAISSHLHGSDDGLSMYRKLLRPIQNDLESCTRNARRFHAQLGFGYRALTSPVIRYSLMKGFALGRTFRDTKRYFMLLPFSRVHPIDWLPAARVS